MRVVVTGSLGKIGREAVSALKRAATASSAWICAPGGRVRCVPWRATAPISAR